MTAVLASSLCFVKKSSQTALSDPIKIGVAGPFTGGSSSMGIIMRDGVRLAIDEINKSGASLAAASSRSNGDDALRRTRLFSRRPGLINKGERVACCRWLRDHRRALPRSALQEAEDPGHEHRGHRFDHHATSFDRIRTTTLPQRGRTTASRRR